MVVVVVAAVAGLPGTRAGVETRDRAVEAGDKGGLLRKPIRASRQSLLPRTAGRWHTVSRFYRVFGSERRRRRRPETH